MPKFALIASESLVNSQGLYAAEFADDITNNHEGWTHTINAVGGFEAANFSLKGDKDYLKDWFDEGILRRVVYFNPEAIPVWEGFVSRMRFTSGTIQETKTIDNLYNRVYMVYNPLDTSTSPPTELPSKTLIFNDVPSQLKYGVKAIVISGGGRTDAVAFDWGQTVLKNRKEIANGESDNITAQDAYSLEVECLGYYHTLKWIPYIKNVTGSLQSQQVIQEVLDYFNTINGSWLSQNFGLMDYNFATSPRGYDDLPSCWDVIENVIKSGGRGGERWVGGIYQNRQFIYKSAEEVDGLYSDEFQLYRSLEDTGQFIYDSATGTEVKPWDMTPDKILHTVDINAGGSRHLKYIEQVTYTEPYGLTLVGEDDERLSVFLARRGLPTI